jgi:hypothetical protein
MACGGAWQVAGLLHVGTQVHALPGQQCAMLAGCGLGERLQVALSWDSLSVSLEVWFANDSRVNVGAYLHADLLQQG